MIKKSSLAILIIYLLTVGCSKTKNTTLFVLKDASSTGIAFNNVIKETDSVNILTEEYIFNGGGVAIGDFNNDELPDVFFSGNQVSNKLYLNKGDFKFQDISDVANISAKDRWNTGIAIIDINYDGWQDIYVCSAREKEASKRANLLFINQGLNQEGVPTFVEMAEQYGIADTANSMVATFFDYDKDGHMDLYVVNNEQVHTEPSSYRKKITDGSAVSNDHLYHNNGDGTFTDVTIDAGIIFEGFGLGIATSDINYDGWEDIYVTNDYLTNDLLYLNNGDGTFSNSIDQIIKHQSKFSMGMDISDYNNDGYLDIITLDMLGETNERMKTTNMGSNYISYILDDRYNYQRQYSRNMLHLGNGPETPFSEIGLLAGVSRTDWSWSPLFADMDNDGNKDLLITNGFPRDITDMDFAEFRLSVSQYLNPNKILDSIPVIKVPNYAYKNNGDLTFKEVGKTWGLGVPSFSNGAVFSDLDNDGDLDYVVNNINDKAFVFENTLNSSNLKFNYLKIKLTGEETNPLGLGTKLLVKLDNDQFQFYEHHLTRGYMSSVDPIIHFGLGSNQVKSIAILWPDGTKKTIKEVPINSTLRIAYQNDTLNQENKDNFSFPFSYDKGDTVFSEKSDGLNINHTHQEKDIIDYNFQRVLPHKLSQNGPCITSGDINGDGLDDFIIGSSATFSPIIFFQQQDKKFIQHDLFSNKEEQAYEEEGMALFDLDNDGDLDLYLVSGSNEFKPEENKCLDRLFINDGKGNFSLKDGLAPKISTNGSVIAPFDFDKDGYTDVFIGGRTPLGQFPNAENSFLLKNNNGVLEDVTERFSKELRKIGMVTDANWQDVNKDGLVDLIIVGEYMPITIFKNNGNHFSKMEATGIDNLYGWWECVTASDFDNDGDIDLVAGNMGKNNLYQPSLAKPVSLWFKDFDNNQSIDPITFSYFKNKQGNYESYPVNFWGDLSKQSPLFRSKFKTYKAFSRTTQNDFFTEEEKEGMGKLKGNFDKTTYFENLGDGTFKEKPLPIECQFAPVNDILVIDYNQDNIDDLLLVGNDFGNEIFIGQLDGLNGLLLQGQGDGSFLAIAPSKSGFVVPGDAKAITKINGKSEKPIVVATQNRGKTLVFEMNLKE